MTVEEARKLTEEQLGIMRMGIKTVSFAEEAAKYYEIVLKALEMYSEQIKFEDDCK